MESTTRLPARFFGDFFIPTGWPNFFIRGCVGSVVGEGVAQE